MSVNGVGTDTRALMKFSAIAFNSRSPSDLKDLSLTVCSVKKEGKGEVMKQSLQACYSLLRVNYLGKLCFSA